MTRVAAAVLAAAVLATGCSSGTSDEPTEQLSAVPLDQGSGTPAPTTTETTSPAPTGTSTPTPAPSPSQTSDVIFLTDHGLTILNLGAEITDALQSLENAFGEPDEDSGWIEGNQTQYGVCPGDATRGVRWGALTALFFRNAPDAPGEWLSAYQLLGSDGDPMGITTPRGITVGDTRADIEAAYGDDAEFFDGEPLYDGIVNLTDTVPGTEDEAVLFGTLDGLEQDSTVLFLQAGDGCGE